MIGRTRQVLSALLRVADTTQSSQPDIDPQLTPGQAEACGGLNMSHTYNKMTEQTTTTDRHVLLISSLCGLCLLTKQMQHCCDIIIYMIHHQHLLRQVMTTFCTCVNWSNAYSGRVCVVMGFQMDLYTF